MRTIQFPKSLTIFVALLLFAGRAERVYGQAATASITGTVTDTSGAAVPGASISAKNNGTGVTRTTTSDNQGRYNLPDLAIGDYDVQSTRMGFQSVVRKGVVLTVGAQPVLDFQLPVGQTQETVNVQASVSQVEPPRSLPWSAKARCASSP
jgi:hypothetical protein